MAIFDQSEEPRSLYSKVVMRSKSQPFPIFLAACGFLVGCGSPAASVSGKVTLDGGALPNGANGGVVFYPVEGGPPATANLMADGSYSLSVGARKSFDPGKYRVAVTVLDALPPRLKDGTQPPGRLVSHSKYQDKDRSGFEVDVTSGTNRIDFDVHRKIVDK